MIMDIHILPDLVAGQSDVYYSIAMPLITHHIFF
jgi:hypothetical protein